MAARRTPDRSPMSRSVVIGVIVALFVTVTPGTAPAAPVTLRPGALMFDQNGNVVQLHGVGVFKVGTTYYAVGEDKVVRSTATRRSAPSRATPRRTL